MASSSSAAIAQVTAEYQDATTNLMCGLAVTVLLLYDAVLTLGQEYRYIWRSSKSWVSRVLYVLNRYMLLLSYILDLGSIPPMSDTSCTVLSWFDQSIQILGLIGPAVFTTLRIYALSRKSKILSGAALVLSMAPFVLNVATTYQANLPINLPTPVNCTQYSTMSTTLHTALICVSRGCLILADTLAVAVTWRQTRRASSHTASTRKRSLEQVMWENGIFYFCTLVSLNVVNLVLVIASTAIEQEAGGPASSYVSQFADPISSILNSRFLLALHETNARLEGANTSISSLTLNIDADGNPIGDGLPELPDFLEPLGGSIRSFHDDEDVDSLEFARPSESQDERESEREGGADDADRIELVEVGLEAGSGGDSGSLV